MTTYIYALVDPNTEDIRYVGKSTNPQARLERHISESKSGRSAVHMWVRGLISLWHVQPELVLLEDAGDNWQEAEASWIARLRADGHNLLNARSGGQQHGVKERKPTPPAPRWYSPERGFYTPDPASAPAAPAEGQSGGGG